MEVVLFESSPSGDYTTYTTGLTGRFSRAGATLSAEGEIVQVAARRPGPAPPPPQDGSGGCARRPRRGLAGGRGGEEAGGIPPRREGGRDARPPGRRSGRSGVGGAHVGARPPVNPGAARSTPGPAPTAGRPPGAAWALRLASGGSPGNYLLNANFGKMSDAGGGLVSGGGLCSPSMRVRLGSSQGLSAELCPPVLPRSPPPASPAG